MAQTENSKDATFKVIYTKNRSKYTSQGIETVKLDKKARPSTQ
jgi:hypothetical protein